jgi:hypothetical protein
VGVDTSRQAHGAHSRYTGVGRDPGLHDPVPQRAHGIIRGSGPALLPGPRLSIGHVSTSPPYTTPPSSAYSSRSCITLAAPPSVYGQARQDKVTGECIRTGRPVGLEDLAAGRAATTWPSAARHLGGVTAQGSSGREAMPSDVFSPRTGSGHTVRPHRRSWPGDGTPLSAWTAALQARPRRKVLGPLAETADKTAATTVAAYLTSPRNDRAICGMRAHVSRKCRAWQWMAEVEMIEVADSAAAPRGLGIRPHAVRAGRIFVWLRPSIPHSRLTPLSAKVTKG